MSAATGPGTTSSGSSCARAGSGSPTGRRPPGTSTAHRRRSRRPIHLHRDRQQPAPHQAETASSTGGGAMASRLSRPGVLLAAFALVATACSGSSASPPASNAAPSLAPSEPAASQVAASQGPATVPPGGPVEIRWYCCLGGGEAPEQKTVEDQVVKDFNASHPNIKLTFEVVTYDQANGQLATELQSGNPPDIVGPVGIGGANAFHGKWLDLKPLIDKTNYDLSGFPANVVDIYKLDEGQVGIPFAIYPSALFYRKSLFEEAGLSEPPHKYGDKYTMPDGSQ